MTNLQRLSEIDRVNVVGTSGSGKSTFGRQLADALRLPFFEMDAIYWRQNWQPAPDEEFFAQVQQVVERQRWVLDGNYARTTPIKWQSVQLVVWIDMPFSRTIGRVISRCVSRSRTQQELWPGTGNRETFRQSFLSRESVIWWAVKSYWRNKRRYRALFASGEHPHIWFVRLTSPASCESFLAAAREAAERKLRPAPPPQEPLG